MNYEIEFLPVGNGEKSGDAILVRYGEEGNYKIMVVDGGGKESGQALVEHIQKYYNTSYVDYVVNTHPDQDHASGLSVVLEELEVGELWIHRPWEYTSNILEHFKDGRITEKSLKERLEKAFKYAFSLEELAKEKSIKILEPYEGARIGKFTVLSPNINWYLYELIPEFNKTPEAKPANESFTDSLTTLASKILESLDYETLKEDGQTSADNESSVILYTNFNGDGILLTGDAGVRALNKAYNYHPQLADNLKFVQVPHHGSRRNVSPSILNKILGDKGQSENKTAFISASKESTKHPRPIVVNAFIRRGCKVCSTEGNTIRHKYNMPNREGWSAVTPLKFKEDVEEYQ
jgi:beta-lactamase superfamily II metal-dependent hydrolase